MTDQMLLFPTAAVLDSVVMASTAASIRILKHDLDIKRASEDGERLIPEMFHCGKVMAAFPEYRAGELDFRRVQPAWVNGISVWGSLWVLKYNSEYLAGRDKKNVFAGAFCLGPDALISRYDPATDSYVDFTDEDKQPWRDYLANGFHL